MTAEGRNLLYSIIVDVTDRLRAEKESLESEARFRAIYDGMPIPTFTWRKSADDFVLADYNQAALRSTKGNIVQYLGASTQDMFRDRNDVKFHLDRSFRKKGVSRLDTEYRFATTGELRDVVFTFAFVPPDLVLEYVEDVTERKQAERRLIASETRYRAIVEDQTELICRFRPDFRLVFANNAFFRYFQEAAGSLTGADFLQLCAEEDRDRVRESLGELHAHNPVGAVEYRAVLPNGDVAWMHATNRAILDANDRVVEYQSVGRDVTDGKMIEERQAASLREKEVLLQEIHHRVKNNLAVVNSLLNLQARKIDDHRLKAIFQESQTRIASMALIHETLYQSTSLASIDFREYVGKLVDSLYRLFNMPSSKVRVKVDAEDVALQIDYAAPCGLVVNELLTNSFKYAFPSDRSGTVMVRARVWDEDTLELVVKDDGVGIPDHIDLHKSGTLGLSLVTSLVERQLKGSMELDREAGTCYTIRFCCGPRSREPIRS